ncbi:hypothetical protein [Sulfuricaulis sp.]|uniref:hypothetical protein n=1 Tax=Sulfuricaulis sp. TaxID=2003553 RepID=UPI0025D7BA86|nr:hypothetical protein [Sulfuricaulis sp.]
MTWLYAPGALAADDHAAHSHESHAAHGEPQALSLNNGKKWITDEPLRRGMGNIRDAIERHRHVTHAGKPTAAQYTTLAKNIHAEAGYIFQNCKLDKKADEALHVILADVLSSAAAIEGRQKGVSRERGVARVAGALDRYGRSFDHSGWEPANK